MEELLKTIEEAHPLERYGRMFSVLKDRYVEKNLPLSGAFELTPHCTLDCKMCYVHSSRGIYSGRMLTGKEWIQIMDKAVDAGMLYATLTGGECFFHPEFREIYSYLRHRGVIVNLLSNGTLIDEDVIAWLKTMPPHSIQVTIYGSCPEVYEQVTGSAEAFYKVDRALDLLHDAKIPVDIGLTISRYNITDFEKLYYYVKQKPYALLNVDCNLFQPSGDTGRELEDFALSLDEQEWIRRKYLALEGHPCDAVSEVDMCAAAQWDKRNSEAYADRMPCLAGRCAFSVSYSGDMQPCTQLRITRVNVAEAGFQAAWSSIHQAAEAYRRSKECQSCEFFGKCTFCPSRYSLHSGGDGGKPGDGTCNKKRCMLIPILMKKAYGGVKDEERV